MMCIGIVSQWDDGRALRSLSAPSVPNCTVLLRAGAIIGIKGVLGGVTSDRRH
jgi:hypothetical protein